MKLPYLKPSQNELLWSGHLYDYSGYAKSNREVLFRVSKHLNVQATSDNLVKEHKTVDLETTAKIDSLFKNSVSKNAALLRFYVPLLEKGSRYKICYTMMETQWIHPEFVRRLNSYYNEVWTPTQWNKDIFRHSGVVRPIHVMPLGVDPDVFGPGTPISLPKCKLLSTKNAGKIEVPSGFNFISIFQPTFRKGLIVTLRAFQSAFGGTEDVNLIIGCTAHGFTTEYLNQVVSNCASAKVYLMSGKFSERDMADIYRSSHAYVSTSMGEGWNLPLIEAGACGIPCIAPAHTGHLQFANDAMAYMVHPDEKGTVYGAGATCIWYAGMPFAMMNEKATEKVVQHMRSIYTDYRKAAQKADLFSRHILSSYTWQHTADKALKRLKELWSC